MAPVSAAGQIGLEKVAVFAAACNTSMDDDSLPTGTVVHSPVIRSDEKEKNHQMQYIRTVLDQTPECQSVDIETVGVLPGASVHKGTATKTGIDTWTLFIPDGSGKNVQRTVTTQELVDSDTYRVLSAAPDSTSLSSATKGQTKRQQKVQRRLLKAERRRRQQMAAEVAKQRRVEMLRGEYERMVGLLISSSSSGRTLFTFCCTLIASIYTTFKFFVTHNF